MGGSLRYNSASRLPGAICYPFRRLGDPTHPDGPAQAEQGKSNDDDDDDDGVVEERRGPGQREPQPSGWGTHPPDGPAQAEQGTGDDDDEDDDDVGGDDDEGGDDKGDWRRR